MVTVLITIIIIPTWGAESSEVGSTLDYLEPQDTASIQEQSFLMMARPSGVHARLQDVEAQGRGGRERKEE